MRSIDVCQLRHADLRAGEQLLLSGDIYTARDAAHVALTAALAAGRPLPFALRDAAIYYAGPTPTPPGRIIGACGPTTSSRMDAFTPALLRAGVAATIGKGNRSAEVCAAQRETGAVYLCAVGGAGALLARCVTAVKLVAYPELGCEAIRRLTVKDMPLIVGIDAQGGSIFTR